ncbi:MAG TPA: DUF2812 domain-containing protein [Candidatus Acidoferrum sp.]|nr:DUF2812 domain-containing protein [Candidatus Acidoferrum sp.]
MERQEMWLNEMAEKGCRLKKCGKITYTFDACGPGEYKYAIEFVGDRSCAKAKDYRSYLKEMGFRTFTKNINLNFSYGKIKWRPYAKGMGQLAISPGGLNKELLIVEKKMDGRPFELHTDVRDKLDVYKAVSRVCIWRFLMALMLVAVTFIPQTAPLSAAVIWALRAGVAVIGVLFLIPAARYALRAARLSDEKKTFE